MDTRRRVQEHFSPLEEVNIVLCWVSIYVAFTHPLPGSWRQEWNTLLSITVYLGLRNLIESSRVHLDLFILPPTPTPLLQPTLELRNSGRCGRKSGGGYLLDFPSIPRAYVGFLLKGWGQMLCSHQHLLRLLTLRAKLLSAWRKINIQPSHVNHSSIELLLYFSQFIRLPIPFLLFELFQRFPIQNSNGVLVACFFTGNSINNLQGFQALQTFWLWILQS